MKKSVKVLLVLAMIMIVGLESQAQIFGVKGGLGLANITSPDPDTNGLFGRALGVKIGGTIEFDLTDDFFLGGGLNFEKKGASSNSGNFNLFYVALPISARFNIVELGRAGHLFVTSGFSPAALVSANLDGNKLNIGNATGDNLKGFDFGFNGGVGVIFDDTFEVGLVSEFGLADISTTNSSNLKNITLLASFGYKFGM